ncbi:MAG: endospore germination permease [Syntrophomonadaceae bacterium]
MDRTRFEITSKQLIFIIVGAQVATAFLNLPRIAAAEAGHHAWLAVIIGAVFPLAAILFTVALLNRFQDADFVNVSHQLFGKFLGTLMVLIFVVYVVIFQSIVIRIFSEITCVFMLPTTPTCMVSLACTLSVVYAVSKGAKVIGRLNEFLFYILIVDILMIVAISIGKGSYLNLLPLGEIDINGLMQGSMKMAYAYAGSEVLLITYAMVQHRHEVLKASLIALGITLLIYLLVVIAGLMVFGHIGVQFITWPVITLLKIPYSFALGRLEIVFLLLWVSLGVKPVMNLGMTASYAAVRTFNLDISRFYAWIALAIGAGIYVLSLLPKNLLQVFVLADYAGYTFLAVSLGYPLLYLLVSAVRRPRSS